jgi:antirestriction protein ArdC
MNDKNFKKLPIQLSDKLIAEIKEGNSLFQKPVKENGMPAFVKPINPTTGKGYSAMTTHAGCRQMPRVMPVIG